MIRVCHFTNGHDSFDPRVFYKQCRSLASVGYDVYLIGPDGITKDMDGVKIRSVSIKYSNRFQRMTKVAYAVYKKALSIDADIYHFHDPELIPYGLKLKKKGKKVIFDSHEDSPADISVKEWIPRPLRKPIASLYRLYEKRAVKKFDAIISVTPHIVDRMRKINEKTYLVTNYPIVDKTEMLDNSRKEKVICYIGRISDEGLQKNVVLAFDKVKDARYLLAGHCEKVYLEMLMKLPQWKKVDYIGEIKFSDSRKLFSASLAGIQLLDYIPNCGFKIGTLGNTKLFGYLEAGIPVICTDFILWKDIIDTYKCGICINPNDIDAIADAINYIITHPDEAIQMGKNGRRAILEKYNWMTQEKELLKCYENIYE
ncbi:MAG: glycosyltransferase family 4 protein [Spirochaetales bacterium]